MLRSLAGCDNPDDLVVRAPTPPGNGGVGLSGDAPIRLGTSPLVTGLRHTLFALTPALSLIHVCPQFLEKSDLSPFAYGTDRPVAGTAGA